MKFYKMMIILSLIILVSEYFYEIIIKYSALGYSAHFLAAFVYMLVILLLVHYTFRFKNEFLLDEKYSSEINGITNSIIFFFFFIIILFGLTFYHLDSIGVDINLFNKKLDRFDAIYFSLVTITTLGYGDILPMNIYAKLLVMFELVIGMWFLITTIPIAISVQKDK